MAFYILANLSNIGAAVVPRLLPRITLAGHPGQAVHQDQGCGKWDTGHEIVRCRLLSGGGTQCLATRSRLGDGRLTQRKQVLHDILCDTLVVDNRAFTANPDLQRRELGALTITVPSSSG